jgi:hypothetical protein
MNNFHWICPYCDRDTTITGANYSSSSFDMTMDSADGKRFFHAAKILCPNAKCKKFTLELTVYDYTFVAGAGKGWTVGKQLQSWRLIPPSTAKVFPAYVPQPIRDDYLEACQIRDLSPKASATLSRRCLQGMIRDFWGIKKDRLLDEIAALEDKVDPQTWEAIDAVRSIGNIGAHMEKDINLIVDVDSNEAQSLIGLIELLIKDWYITRHERAERLKTIVAIRDLKAAIKTGQP